MRNLPFVNMLGESAWPVTLPSFKEVISYGDGKPLEEK